MLLRYFYDEKLAHASYLVGCQATGEAVIIDPMRDIGAYSDTVNQEGLTITGALETHIHADFVSGSRELAHRYGAKMYISDEGDADWKYQNLESVNYQLLKDGDKFIVGNLVFEVLHTPGHTPESISFLLTDKGGNADKPMGIFTGDFVFVGDIGRPDLLEKAAGYAGTSEAGAKEMFRSINRFKQLPEYLQVWPAHGAGSACGKALGAVPSTTVGYEKLFNWALQIDDEEPFISELLDGQPEPPSYFSIMKKVNKVGPALVEELPALKTVQTPHDVGKLKKEGKQLIDVRESGAFSNGHLEGSINLPYNQSFANWAGWLIDYDQPVYLLIDGKHDLQDILKTLRSVGIDQVEGFGDAHQLLGGSSPFETYQNVTPVDAEESVASGDFHVVDVRSASEWEGGHIAGAQHIMLGTLPDRIDEVKKDKPILVQCGSGVRSAIGTSVLQAKGIKDVHNLLGGYARWVKETGKDMVK